METITISVSQEDVYEEVAKATDYTGAKLINTDGDARDRIMAADDDLANLGRFWEESVSAANENMKEMLVSGKTIEREGKKGYEAEIEVSKAFDKTLSESVQSTIRSFLAQWFKFANKGEAKDYFAQASEMMEAAERLLYSRRKPTRPTD